MDFQKLAEERYSVRDFSDRPIEADKLEAVLNAGRVAPTAVNAQPQTVYVVKSQEGLARMRTLTRCHFNAPVVLMFAYDRNLEWKNYLEEGVTSGQQDVSIVATHIMLAAQNLGLGTCWVNVFSPTQVKAAFNLPESQRVVLLMPIGYPGSAAVPSPRHTSRKPLDETVMYL